MLEAEGIEPIDLAAAGIAEDAAREEGLECHDTFERNAIAKARYFFEVSGGMPTLADDSGLEVISLGGTPGVRSKRWSGRTDLSGGALDAANNEKLLLALADSSDRRARYVCVAAYVDGVLEAVERGETTGRILLEPRGSGGFGYDPYFMSSDLSRTFAECAAEEKARVSHRGRAVRALLQRLAGG